MYKPSQRLDYLQAAVMAGLYEVEDILDPCPLDHTEVLIAITKPSFVTRVTAHHRPMVLKNGSQLTPMVPVFPIHKAVKCRFCHAMVLAMPCPACLARGKFNGRKSISPRMASIIQAQAKQKLLATPASPIATNEGVHDAMPDTEPAPAHKGDSA